MKYPVLFEDILKVWITNNFLSLFLVKPNAPYLEVNTAQIAPGQNFTVKEDRPSSIKCVSRYGNPASDLRWFIGE